MTADSEPAVPFSPEAEGVALPVALGRAVTDRSVLRRLCEVIVALSDILDAFRL